MSCPSSRPVVQPIRANKREATLSMHDQHDEVFTDIATVVGDATTPCVLFFTVNVDHQQATNRFQRFSDAVGAERIPPGYNSDHDLNDWGTAGVLSGGGPTGAR